MRKFIVTSLMILFVVLVSGAASTSTEPIKVVPQPNSIGSVTSTAPAFPAPVDVQAATPTPAKIEPTPAPAQDVGEFAKMFFNAAKNGDWKLLIVLIVVGIVWALRKWGAAIPKVGEWLATDRGGAILALLAGIFGVIGTGLVSGSAWSFALIRDGLLLGFTAAGGWTIIKKILGPNLWEIMATGTKKQEQKVEYKK